MARRGVEKLWQCGAKQGRELKWKGMVSNSKAIKLKYFEKKEN